MNSEKGTNNNGKKPKKVFYVWDYLEWGGAQVYFLGIASRIKDRTDVRFLFPRETSSQFINFCENAGIEYDFLESVADLKPADTLKRKLERHLNKLKSERYLVDYLKNIDFQGSILHIELSPWQSALALSNLCRRAKVFITMHNALPEVSNWRQRLWKRKFSKVTKSENFHLFASNRHARESLKSFVSKDFFKQIKVTYTNVNPDEIDEALSFEIDREKILEQFGLPKNKFLVFCLGQFIDRKGRWTFLDAAKKLSKDEPEIAFVWISNSILSAEDEKRVKNYGLDGKFFHLKSEDVGKEHKELMKFLRLADVYTLPSFVEGLPISLLEAMALGIPSISTNVYAIPEAVIDDETGILIEAGDADALAGAIVRLKNDENLRNRLGQSGREWVLSNFNEKKVAEIAFEAYSESFKG